MVVTIPEVTRYLDLLGPLEAVRQGGRLLIFHHFGHLLFHLPVLLLLFGLKFVEPFP